MPVEQENDRPREQKEQGEQEEQEEIITEDEKPPIARRIITFGIIFLAAAFAVASAFYITQMIRQPKKKADTNSAADLSKQKIIYLNLDEFTVNLSSEGEYLATKMVLELTNEDVKKEIANNMPRIRDKILSILMSKTASSLLVDQGKDLLKKDIMDKLNPGLTSGKISNIHFTEFLMQ